MTSVDETSDARTGQVRDLLGSLVRVTRDRDGKYRDGRLVAVGYEHPPAAGENGGERVVVVRFADGYTMAFPESLVHLEPAPDGGEVERLAGLLLELAGQSIDGDEGLALARRLLEAGYVRAGR